VCGDILEISRGLGARVCGYLFESPYGALTGPLYKNNFQRGQAKALIRVL
jgi:hypothetical protein